jgi:tetratricopeptide (TPR) repeat protein
VSSEYENLRAAFEWIEAEPNGNESGLLLASGMLGAAASRGRIGELRRLLTVGLARADPTARTPGRALALGTVAMLEAMQGDIQLAGTHNREAVGLLRALGMKRDLAYALVGVARATLDDPVSSGRASNEARALFADLGDKWGLAMMLFVMADAAMERGDYDAARTGHTESLALFRSIGEVTMSTNPLVSLARIACVDGEYARARAMIEEALTIRQRPEVDNPWMVAIALDSLGEVARCEGDPARGTRSFEQALGYGRALGDDMIVSWSLHNLGHVALHSGDLAAGAAQFRESLALRWRRGPGVEVATGLAGMASVALRDGEFADAAKLFGAVDGMLDSARSVLAPADEQVKRGDLVTLRERLDKDALAEATRANRTMGFEELETLSNAIAVRVGRRSR